MSMERTLPWMVEASPPGDVYDAQIYGQNGTLPVLIAEVMDKDEAALIVKAVNLHDELLAVLRDALPYVDRHESANFSNIALDISARGHALLARVGATQ